MNMDGLKSCVKSPDHKTVIFPEYASYSFDIDDDSLCICYSTWVYCEEYEPNGEIDVYKTEIIFLRIVKKDNYDEECIKSMFFTHALTACKFIKVSPEIRSSYGKLLFQYVDTVKDKQTLIEKYYAS